MKNIEKRNYESHIQLHIGFWPFTHTHTFTYADRVPYKPTITATTTIIKYYIAYFDLGRVFFFLQVYTPCMLWFDCLLEAIGGSGGGGSIYCRE